MTTTSKKMNYTLWTIQILLAALFLFAGAMKLILPLEALNAGPVHLPGFLLRFIGVAEVLGGLGLVLPGALRVRRGLTPLAAGGLVIIMVGATVLTLSPIPAVVGVLLAFVAYQRTSLPDTFRVERTRSIQAPREQIFELINDFRNWGVWSPYEKLDPAMNKNYSGAPCGVGAVYEWSGNNKVGQGRMEILATAPASNVTIQLDFIRPFAGHNTAEFTLQAEGDATRVTWATYGKKSLPAKIMSLVVSLDKMIGKDFEAGLENLKAVAEAHAAMEHSA